MVNYGCSGESNELCGCGGGAPRVASSAKLPSPLRGRGAPEADHHPGWSDPAAGEGAMRSQLGWLSKPALPEPVGIKDDRRTRADLLRVTKPSSSSSAAWGHLTSDGAFQRPAQ